MPSVLTIGKFDGLHRGHAALLARVRSIASTLGAQACVMTFEPHPRDFFARRASAGAVSQPAVRAANCRDTMTSLAHAGVDRMLVQRFDEAFAALSPEAFIHEVLIERLDVRWLLVGADFRFGAKRTGDVAMLTREGRRHGFQVETVPTLFCGDMRISSSEVRRALADADFARAHTLLGRTWSVSGRLAASVTTDRDARAVRGGHVVRFLGLAHSPLPDGLFAVRVHRLAGPAVPATLQIQHNTRTGGASRDALGAFLLLPASIEAFDARERVTLEFVVAECVPESAEAVQRHANLLPAPARLFHHDFISN